LANVLLPLAGWPDTKDSTGFSTVGMIDKLMPVSCTATPAGPSPRALHEVTKLVVVSRDSAIQIRGRRFGKKDVLLYIRGVSQGWKRIRTAHDV
jgi:hypothetical protein